VVGGLISMRLWLLGSGSGGNAVLIESDDARILIDAGFGIRTLVARMKSAGIAPDSIDACLITHEHSDHVRGAAAGARRWGWALHATRGTIAASSDLSGAHAIPFAAGESLAFGGIDVATARTPHDAAEPVGVVVTERTTGARAAVCTDFGHVTGAVRHLCADVDILVLESNHDEGMLRAGPYPPVVQARIASDSGHLANRHAAALVRDSVSPRLKHVVLAHISQHCNQPELARAETERETRRTAFRGRIATASQDEVIGPFSACARGAARTLQYSLGL
jgi:phosphoribosyl 1,2-cyclic phosphodiesterase